VRIDFFWFFRQTRTRTVVATKVEQTHHNVIPPKARIQEGGMCMAKQFFVYIMAGGSNGTPYVGVTSNPVQRAGQSRVERSLWRDLRLDWIPAFCGNDAVVTE